MLGLYRVSRRAFRPPRLSDGWGCHARSRMTKTVAPYCSSIRSLFQETTLFRFLHGIRELFPLGVLEKRKTTCYGVQVGNRSAVFDYGKKQASFEGNLRKFICT